MPTINDYLNNTNGIGEKPATPIEGGSEPIFTPGGQDVIEGPTTRPVGEPSSGAVDKEGNVIDTTGRVGDYVYFNGRAYVVPNSMTDLYRRYGIVRGGTKPQDLKFTDYVNAALSGLGARMGLPTDTSNAATTLGTGFASRLLSSMPVVRDIWGMANTISSLEAAKKAYLDYWANQDVEYDIALDFSTDENGNQIAKINYEKMKDAGPGSGIAIREATNAENSDVFMKGDNSLSVNVSESFANSDIYKDTLEQIKEAYPSLSVDEANTVINEETGATVLDTIKKFILAQEMQYYYNAKSIYDFKQIAPNASQDNLEKATYTQLMGAMDENSLKEMTVTVYNEQNEMEEKNAEEYLNSIKDLDDRGRENYMVSIGNRVKSDDISDDEKVILQAQANALYMASNNDGPYKDMYRKDLWDSIADTGTLLFGIRSGNLFGIDELTTFEENELFRGGIDLVTGLARFKIQSSVMNKIEGLERLGAQGLGKAIGDNALGRFMQNINVFAPQDTPIKVTDIGKALPNGSTLTAGGFLGRTLTQQGAQMAADLTFDLGKMGAYAIAGEDYDFWDELGTDFFIDALMTYGPSAYIESMTAPKYERKRVAYMGDEYKKGTLDDINKRMEEDEFSDGKYQGPTGAGLYEVKFVELTADELAKRRAEKIDKLTDSKIGLKVQELFFDRNAAMGKLATQIRSVVGGDNYYFRKMLRYSGDIRQLTKDVVNEYKMRDTAKAALSNLSARIQEIAPKAKDFTKADADYVNAIANRTRFLAEWKGDKDAEKAINEFYEKAINGVSAERAEQLNGLVDAMRQVAADGIDFYGERGILSKKQIRDLRKSPVYKDGIYLPVWTKAGKSLDGDISQSRAKIKSVFDPKVLISVDDLENPIVTIASYLNNIARNVAINDRAMAIREAANIAGVKIHILDDTSGVLSEVSNLRELNADFEKKYQKIVEEVKKAVPTRKQWQEINNKLILDSAAMKGASELERLKDKEKNLKKELRDERKAQDDIRANAIYAPEKIQNTIGDLSKLSAGKISDSELKSNIRAIPATESMLARLPKNSTAYKRLSRALDKAKTNLKNNGYKVGNFAYVGRKYNDGMNVDVIAKDAPSGYNGQLYIKEVFSPDVDKDGKVLLRAQVIVGDQPKKPEVPDFENNQKEIRELDDAIRATKADIDEIDHTIMMLSSISADFDIAALSYDERRQLAEDVADYNRNADGFSDYILLYRVQNGKPDGWHPNDHGIKGKFEPRGGEEALKGAVWLTADRKWAEGPDRATSGVKDATNENIVVIPVKRSDILNLGTEVNAKSELDKSGKKIVKTRGIDGGLKKSEYILWENEHPEIFEEAWDAMLDRYAENQYRMSEGRRKRLERQKERLGETLSSLQRKRDNIPASNYYSRFPMGEDASSKYVADFTPETYDFHGAIERMFVGTAGNDRTLAHIGYPDDVRISFDSALPRILRSSAGATAFSDEIAAFNGDPRAAADGIYQRFLEAIGSDPRTDKAVDTADERLFADVVDDIADEMFSESQAKAIEDWFNKQNSYTVLKQRDATLDNWRKLQPLIQRLGIGGYTYAREDKYSPMTDGAYGVYRWLGVDNPYGYDDRTSFKQTDYDDGTMWLETMNPQNIVLSIRAFETLPAMKSTLVHEAAHAAFSKAANRVAILKDALRIIGVKNAEVTDKIATSTDATELIAYMTQKKYLSDLAKRAVGKEHKEIIDHLMQDSVIQGHLDNIMNMLGRPSVNFKRNFIEVIYDAITFIKAKVAGTLSLRNTNTFEEFYSGLISGRFASDMRVDTTGTPTVRTDSHDRSELDFEWWRVSPDAEEMALRIIKIQERIDANKQAQLRRMDNIKNEAQRLMEEAQAINKASPVKLDIQSYTDVQLTNELKQAFRSNTPTGEIQAILNKAVEEANPYVSRSSVIAREAGEAARKFRKRVYRDMKVKENVYGKKTSDKVNDLVDKVTDHIVTKVTGEQKTLTAIDDNELTRILNNNDDPHTIRYMIDGTEHKMVLTGKGSEELVREFYAPEYKATNGVRRILRFGNSIAQAKRYLTTSADPTRVLPNLARDWSRGIVTTGGEILLSPDQLRTDAIERGNYTPEQIEKIDNGFRLANEAIDESTFTASMQQPRKNRKKSMIRAMNAPTDGNAFVRFIYDRTESAGKFFSTLQDMGESFTRRRAMANAYYKELAAATARGLSIDEAVKRATAAAYFYGREATVNFFRRGKLIAEIAQMVPYLSQNFASLESFKYAYLDNPIAVTRSLKATVSTYATLIALALSNDESRKRYFLLTEYDRAHNIIIPLANDLIVTVPLDENVAAFLTPYRRMIETLNGVDPEAFYLWAAEGLEALSPLDLSGFSEGDKFNVVRGFEKIGSQVIPTWAQPILESMTGTDWFYGTDISIDEDYVGARTGNWNPTPGELTTKSKNSEILSHVANATGIPQWIVQNIYSEYGGNVGQYFLNTLDKLTGATEEAQGGKEFFDSIFKPMTGAESDEANNAFWTGVSRLNEEKAALQRELKTIKEKTEAATGEAKAELQKKRQEKIKEFGTRVSDFLTQYLSAFEITGGLTKSQANRIWRLYDIYDQDDNEQLYRSGSPEEYFDKQANKQANKETTNLAGLSGLDKFYHTPIDDYHRTYAEQMFRNTIYGSGTQSMVDIANILEDTSDYENSFTKLRSDAIEARKKARTEEDWDNYDKIAYQYDYKVLSALYPYLLEHGVADTLNNNAVIKYLDEWILIPSEEMRTSKGRYVPNLGVDSEKHKAFTKQFVKRMYGVSGE